MIDAGTILTASIGGSTGYGFQSGDDIISDAVSLMSTNDGLIILSSQNAKASLIDQVTTISTPFTATLKVKTTQAYASEDDVLSIINGDFYAGSGNNTYPTGSIVDVTPPGGTAQATGEGSQPSPNPPGTPQSISDAISNFFSGLQSTSQTLLIVVVGIVVLVLFLAAYGPNVGSIAKVAAIA